MTRGISYRPLPHLRFAETTSPARQVKRELSVQSKDMVAYVACPIKEAWVDGFCTAERNRALNCRASFVCVSSGSKSDVSNVQDSLMHFTPDSFGSASLGDSIQFRPPCLARALHDFCIEAKHCTGRSVAGAQKAEMFQCVDLA